MSKSYETMITHTCDRCGVQESHPSQNHNKRESKFPELFGNTIVSVSPNDLSITVSPYDEHPSKTYEFCKVCQESFEKWVRSAG